MADKTTDALFEALEDFGVKLVDDLQKSASSHKSSGNLEGAMNFEIAETNKGISFQLIQADYYDYLDKGVQGTKKNRAPKSPYKYTEKQPPLAAIRQWLSTKSFGVQGSKPTDKSAQAYVVAKSIKEKGTEPTNFYSDVVNDDLLDGLRAKLLAATNKTITVQIEDLAKGL
jgi:hypothetical protein